MPRRPVIHPPPVMEMMAQSQELPPAALSNGRFIIWQWKGVPDATWPLWRRAFFWCVHRPYYQLAKHLFDMPVFPAQDEQGNVGWIDFQTQTPDRWRAIQICEENGWNWGYEWLPDDFLLPSEGVAALDHDYPASSASPLYKRGNNRNPEEKVALGQLVEATAQARRTLAAHR